MSVPSHLIFLLIALGFVVVPLVAARIAIRIFHHPLRVPVSIGASVVLWGAVYFGWYGIACRQSPPTLIEDLQTGKVRANQVAEIQFARLGAGLCRRESKLLESVTPLDQIFDQLSNQLTSDIYQGRRHRNHPAVFSPKRGLIVTFNDGSKYVIHFTVYTHSAGNFVSIDAWPRIPSSSKGADTSKQDWQGLGILHRHYESSAFLDFVTTYDPWYSDETQD